MKDEEKGDLGDEIDVELDRNIQIDLESRSRLGAQWRRSWLESDLFSDSEDRAGSA